MRVPMTTFVALELTGSALYVGVPIVLGRTFHAAVNDILARLESFGHLGIGILLAALALFFAGKWWQRHRLIRGLRMTRITVPELQRMLDDGGGPAIIDVRPAGSRERDGTIPGALAWSASAEDSPAAGLSRDGEVVVYCDCPNEYSAAKVAQQLRRAGFRNVRPLHGGLDAWIAAGLPVQQAASETIAALPVTVARG